MTVWRWTLRTPVGDKMRVVEVRLYETLGSMRGAATRHSLRVGDTTTDFSTALGCCQGFTTADVSPTGTAEPRAIVRLVQDNISLVIVAHEMIHAAQHIYQADYVTKDALANDHMHAGNEDFAFLAGELVAAGIRLFFGPEEA